MLRVTDDHRRARLAHRHSLLPGSRSPSIEAATRAVVALHATEGSSVHLALHARVDGLRVEDVDAALCWRLSQGQIIANVYKSQLMRGDPLP